MKLVIALAALALVAAPAAAELIVVGIGMNGETYYVADSGVWQESNGCEDLQSQPVNCNLDNDFDAEGNPVETIEPADTSMA